MIILPLQFEKHTGPDAVGQHKFTFSMDESLPRGPDFKNLISVNKGTQFLVVMIEAGSNEATEFAAETKEETLSRFKKHMEVLISDIADLKGLDKEKYRDEIKSILKKEGRIDKSTTELDLDGYANVITRLKKVKFKLENERTNQ